MHGHKESHKDLNLKILNFVVSAITFEGFKLRSSYLTHAYLTHCVPSKMAAGGHFVKKNQKKVAYQSEMARNAIESDFRTSKMSAGSHFVKQITKYKLWY